MYCPKCGNSADGMRLHVHMDATRTKMRCDTCGWASDYVESLVRHSPAYRLARLKAQGAEPGWYGPDGQMASPFGRLAVIWRGGVFRFNEARVCGFVEVPNE